MQFSSVVVDEVNLCNVRSVEAKSNAPVSAHPDRPRTSHITLQGVKLEAWQVHFFRPAGLDADIVEQFRATGRGWQTRLNAALKQWLKAHSGD